jgi:hypothetical protein
MLEANPTLSPERVRTLLLLACRRVDGAPRERQGAGAIDAGSAVALALLDASDVEYPAPAAESRAVTATRLRFVLHAPDAMSVRVAGSWDAWSTAGVSGNRITGGLWEITLPAPPAGAYAYKFLENDSRWVEDPANRSKESDGAGGWNSRFVVAGGSSRER